MVQKVEEPFKLLKYLEGADKWRKSFEKMCSNILHCKYKNKKHTVIRIDGSGGDDGIDVWVKTPKAKIHIYQCKFHLENLDASQKNKISDSFLTAYEKNKHEGFVKWILVIPKTLIKNELRWWNELCEKHKDKEIKFKLWDEDELLNLLEEYKLYDTYFQFKDRFKESREQFEKDFSQIISKFENGVDIFHINDIDNMYGVSEKWKASSYLNFRNSAIAYTLDHFLINLSVVNGIIHRAEPFIQEQFQFLMKYYFIPEYYRLCRERDNEQDEKAIEFYTNNNAGIFIV
jgi:hypothetical protein